MKKIFLRFLLREFQRAVAQRRFKAFFFLGLALISFLVLSALLGLPSAESWQARLVTVSDGDTVVLSDQNGEKFRVRLYGIDCPELDQPGGRAAQEAARHFLGQVEPGLIFVQEAEQGKGDKYGRKVATIRKNDEKGQSLQDFLLAEGLAWVYWPYCRQQSTCASWAKLEKAAQAQRLGIWADEDPVPPWLWRKQKE